MPRRDFPNEVKRQAAARANGRCENCTARLPYGQVHYDHVLAAWLGGEPVLGNCRVLCVTCHRRKTAKGDAPTIAKAKRRRDRAIGIKKPRSIRGWRRFNGDPVWAPRERG